jgi:D-apionolactonase
MSAQLISENRILLQTPELSCFFESRTGFLRQVMVDGHEVVRAIYGAVRDQNWNTVPPEIVVGQVTSSDEHFYLQFQVKCSSAGIAFSWNGTIEGRAGTLSFAFTGQAESTFKKNRIGLCLLHPIQGCAGQPCRVRETGQSWIESEFPLFISPHQPFKNLGAISWKPAPNLEATVTFAGDVFETEDQRNWTDASFKTYSTPLDKPFPVEIAAGTPVHQQITVELDRTIQSPVLAGELRSEVILISAQGEKALPALGLGLGRCGGTLSETERARLAALNLHHLRVDICFDDPRWNESLERATTVAKEIGTRLQPALFLSGPEDLRAFSRTVDHQILPSCLIFHRPEASTSEHWLELAAGLLPRTAIVGGTNANFTELNRHRPTTRFPTAFSLNPQVHAFDDLSLIENLEGQPEVIQSARQFCATGLYVSPVTLRPRSNPGEDSLPLEPSGPLPFSVDPRQRTLFGATWTVGSLARLLPESGIESLTYYEAIGWKGVMESEQGNPHPHQFGSSPGEIFPVYHVFHALAEAEALFPVINPVPQKIAVVGFRQKGAVHVLLANLQSENSLARLLLPADQIAVQILSEDHLATLRQGRLPDPEIRRLAGGEAVLALPSYALALLRCI